MNYVMHCSLAALLAFVDEARRLAGLSGNCGRVVSRFIERYFPRGEVTFTLVLNPAVRPLGMLMLVNELLALHGSDFMRVRLAEPYGIGSALPDLRMTLVPDAMPSNLRERRAFLCDMARRVERVLRFLQYYGDSSMLDTYDALFGDRGDSDLALSERDEAVATRLLLCDPEAVRNAPIVLSGLAACVDPAVQVILESTLDSVQRMEAPDAVTQLRRAIAAGEHRSVFHATLS